MTDGERPESEYHEAGVPTPYDAGWREGYAAGLRAAREMTYRYESRIDASVEIRRWLDAALAAREAKDA